MIVATTGNVYRGQEEELGKSRERQTKMQLAST